MSNLRVPHHLLFTADFPDEVVFDNHGEIQTPAGLEVAEAVVGSLGRCGYECTDVVQRDYYGWEFEFAFRYTRVSVILQRIDKWILTLTPKFMFKNMLLRRRRCPAPAIAEQLAAILKAGVECDEMCVFTDDELRVYLRA